MAFQLAKAYVEFSQKGMGGIVGGIGSLAGKLKSLVSPMGLVTAGLGALGAGAGIGGMLKLYSEQEDAEKRLEQVVRATGGAAGYTAAELKKMASDLQQVTKFGDETTLAAQATMLTFKQIRGDVFKDAIESAMDLQSVFGGDLQSSTLQLGKALEDPIAGLTALRRVGVSFNDQQKETIKSLVKTNRLADAQRIILDAIAGQVGGSAKAAAQTFGGQWQQAKNAMGDVMEQIGKAIADTFNLGGLVGGIKSFAENFQTNFGPAIAWMQSAVGSMVAWITEKFSAMTAWLKGVWDFYGGAVIASLKMQGAYYRMIFEIAYEVISGVVSVIASAVNWINEAWAGLWGKSVEEMRDFGISVYEQMEFMFTNWKLYLQIGWQEFLRFVMNIPAYFAAAVTNMGNLIMWFGENWRDILFTSADYVLTIMSNLGQNIRNIWQAVLDFFSGNGFNVDWTPLTQGFHNSIKKMPELVKAEIHKTTPELDKLYKELDKRRQAFEAKKRGGATEAEEAATPGETPAPGVPGAPGKPGGAGSTENKFKFYGLAAFADQMQQAAAKQAEGRQTMDLQRQQADATTRLADAASGGGLKVTVTNAVDLQPAY
jgi:hypothetical protein